MKPACGEMNFTSCHVCPPSVDLKMPQPGEIVLRESSSPVPAQTCVVSDGAIATSPIDTHFSLSKTGRKVVPALVVFQMPPAAAATKNVFDGLGMPVTLETRPPMFAGPIARQRKPASSVESSVIPSPVITVAFVVIGFCGRGSSVRARARRDVSGAAGGGVGAGVGCGGGAGGFCEYKLTVTTTVRTANMTASLS